MTISTAELDTMPESEAAALLTECCGASRWVADMLALRPFGSIAAALSGARGAWESLGATDWLEAFAHHPRIGERVGSVKQGERGSTWSRNEQSGLDSVQDNVRDELARTNREYENRFGYIYIVCATGKSAQEMLALAHERLHNDPVIEIRVAAEEQRKIMLLRLGKLLDTKGTM